MSPGGQNHPQLRTTNLKQSLEYNKGYVSICYIIVLWLWLWPSSFLRPRATTLWKSPTVSISSPLPTYYYVDVATFILGPLGLTALHAVDSHHSVYFLSHSPHL